MAPASAEEARQLGIGRHYTGKPCKRGHVAERNTKSGICRECIETRSSEYYKKHPESRRRSFAKWMMANKDRYCAQLRRYRQSVIGHAKRIARARERKVTALRAMPSWANKGSIDLVYIEARRLSLETGIKHHVDHEVPLKHLLVCGLHVHHNLRVISARDNLVKSNRFEV